MLPIKEPQYLTDSAPTIYSLSLKLFHTAIPLESEEEVFLLCGAILCSFNGRDLQETPSPASYASEANHSFS